MCNWQWRNNEKTRLAVLLTLSLACSHYGFVCKSSELTSRRNSYAWISPSARRSISSTFDYGSLHISKEHKVKALQAHKQLLDIPTFTHIELGPPEPLASLEVGEAISLFGIHQEAVSIERVAFDPPIYILHNFLPSEVDRMQLMMNCDLIASTKSGFVPHRKNSYVYWIDPTEAMEQLLNENLTEETSRREIVAAHMTILASHLVVPSSTEEEVYEYESVQVVKYDPKGGKFDLHHDGFHRYVTVLTYLNGIAGTWFPFATLDEKDESNLPASTQITMEAVGILDDRHPSKHGVLIVGQERNYGGRYSDLDLSSIDENNPHVVLVRPGDAVVFYNYLSVEDSPGPSEDNSQFKPTMNWRSLHAALETQCHDYKWIATNWFQLCSIPS